MFAGDAKRLLLDARVISLVAKHMAVVRANTTEFQNIDVLKVGVILDEDKNLNVSQSGLALDIVGVDLSWEQNNGYFKGCAKIRPATLIIGSNKVGDVSENVMIRSNVALCGVANVIF